MNKLLLVLAITFLSLTGCKKDDPSSDKETKHISGLVEKGPFIRGSKVSIIELDNNLNQTGKIFESEILNDEGYFKLDNIELASRYIQLSVDGFYFDEVRAELSKSRITLGAFADVQSQNTVNTNIITHIEQRRVKQLISKESKSFKEAKEQAQKEILAAFYIKGDLNTTSEKVSITGSNKSADILLAISAAILNGINSDAELTERLSSIAENIGTDGKLNEANDALIINAIETLDLERIKTNVIARYKEFGKEIEMGDLASYFTLETYSPEAPVDPIIESQFKNYEAYIEALRTATISFTHYLENYYLIEALYSNSTNPSATLTGNLPQIYTRNISSANSGILDLFTKSYQTIRRYNLIADNALNSTDPQVKTLEYITYPYLGYIYWSMMEMWGDVPYVTPANYNNIEMFSRLKVNDIRTDLINKLAISVQNIEFSKNDFQFDKAFPLGVLVKLSLQAEDYNKTKLYAEQIINSNNYQLSPLSELHSTSKESIFGYQKDEFPVHPRTNYLNLINKGEFIHVIRYTEVVLAAAEASIKLDDRTNALKYLNQIRVRNNKSALISSNKEEILTAILSEIKEDLGKEGLWFPTLKRNGLAIGQLNIPEYKLLFPIPQKEIDLNYNMTQNPGY